MKKVIFTFLFAAVCQMAFSQTTYYWVGGNNATSVTATTNWNTTLGGGGTSPTVLAASDIYIFDGSNVGPGSTGPVVSIVGVTGTPTVGQLKFVNFADVSMERTGSGTMTFNVNGTIAGTDFYIDPFSRLRLTGSVGSIVVVIRAGNTGEVEGEVSMGPNGNSSSIQNRLVSSTSGALRFKAGSTAVSEPNYGYSVFGSTGSSATPAAGGGVVFEANSRYIHNSGGSPFGTSTTTSLTTFLPGSKFYFRAPATGSVHFSNRAYADVFVENNATVTMQGSVLRMDSLVINTGSTLITDSSGALPIAGHLVVNGSLLSPVPPAERDNKISFVGATPQNISGTGTITVADVYISNQSNVTLQRNIKIDSLLMIVGMFNQNGKTITGSPTIISKTPASVNTTGSTVDSSYIVTVANLSGVEIGMSVTGSGIPANTVISNLSTTNMTITISNRAVGTLASTALTIFNGQGTVLPIKFGAVLASLVNGQTKISWNILLEESIIRYGVERSFNGINFTEIGSLNANRSSNYAFTDNTPAQGTNLYRIKAIGIDGEIRYSNILRVNNAKDAAALSVYPNPVKGGVVNIQLGNLEKGNYTIRLFNTNGQTVFSQVLNHNGGSSNQTLSLPANVKTGIYNLNIIGDIINLQHRLIVE